MANSLAVAAGGRRFASGWIRISGPLVDFRAPVLLEAVQFPVSRIRVLLVRTSAFAYSLFITTPADGHMAVEAVPFIRKAGAFLAQSVQIIGHVFAARSRGR